jgi:hypothetical protein
MPWFEGGLRCLDSLLRVALYGESRRVALSPPGASVFLGSLDLTPPRGIPRPPVLLLARGPWGADIVPAVRKATTSVRGRGHQG